MWRIISLTATVIILISVLASCSSKSVGPYRDYYDDYHYTYTYHPYTPYTGKYTTYRLLQPPKPAVQVTGLFSTRTIPGTYEDIRLVTETCAEALDPAEFENDYSHVPLYPELTYVGGKYFSLASTSVTYEREIEDPTIRLTSRPDRASIAVYHFSEIPAGRTISTISIDNHSRFYGLEDHGFFLGYRYDEGEEYQWYGPFGVDDSWLLPLAPRLTYQPTNPSLVVVTTRGDILDLRSFTVSVDSYHEAYSSWQLARAQYDARLHDLERERYELQLEQQWLYQEWQRLEYENYLLRERELALKYERLRRHRDDGYRHRDHDRDRNRGHDRGWERGEEDSDGWETDDTQRGRRIEVVETGRRLDLGYDLSGSGR